MPGRLIKRLIGGAAAPAFTALPAPFETCYAVGDIHGRSDLLARLLDLIAADAGGPGTAPMVFLGDYVDRGEDSRSALERLAALERSAPSSVVCLAGNHERMMLDFLDRPAEAARRWLRNGGVETLASFGIAATPEAPDPDAAAALAARLRQAMGAPLEAWLRTRPLHHASGNVHFVHAGADPARPMETQAPEHLVWGHPAFARLPRQDGQWVAHGHTVTDTPRAEAGRIALDTGAWFSGRLTAARIAPGEVTFLGT